MSGATGLWSCGKRGPCPVSHSLHSPDDDDDHHEPVTAPENIQDAKNAKLLLLVRCMLSFALFARFKRCN
jgi:hypothetical protein